MVSISLQSFPLTMSLFVMLHRVEFGFEYFRAFGAFEYFPSVKSSVMFLKGIIPIHILTALWFGTVAGLEFGMRFAHMRTDFTDVDVSGATYFALIQECCKSTDCRMLDLPMLPETRLQSETPIILHWLLGKGRNLLYW